MESGSLTGCEFSLRWELIAKGRMMVWTSSLARSKSKAAVLDLIGRLGK